jgi:hypothetical protein
VETSKCRCINAVVIGSWRDHDVAISGHDWNITRGPVVFVSFSSGEVDIQRNSTFIPLAHDPAHVRNEWPSLAAAFGWFQCALSITSLLQLVTLRRKILQSSKCCPRNYLCAVFFFPPVSLCLQLNFKECIGGHPHVLDPPEFQGLNIEQHCPGVQ